VLSYVSMNLIPPPFFNDISVFCRLSINPRQSNIVPSSNDFMDWDILMTN
jgi:hypothetical protein